jgi:hypothetical protein
VRLPFWFEGPDRAGASAAKAFSLGLPERATNRASVILLASATALAGIPLVAVDGVCVSVGESSDVTATAGPGPPAVDSVHAWALPGLLAWGAWRSLWPRATGAHQAAFECADARALLRLLVLLRFSASHLSPPPARLARRGSWNLRLVVWFFLRFLLCFFLRFTWTHSPASSSLSLSSGAQTSVLGLEDDVAFAALE